METPIKTKVYAGREKEYFHDYFITNKAKLQARRAELKRIATIKRKMENAEYRKTVENYLEKNSLEIVE